MKKRTVYILLIALVGLSFTTACNDKEFYDYETPVVPAKEPYTLKLAVKMSADDLARLDKVEGKLTGILIATDDEKTRALETGEVDFEFTKVADGIAADVKVKGVDRSAKQILTMTLKHANGNVSAKTTDITEQLAGLNNKPTDTPVSLDNVPGIEEIVLPGSADDALGGGSLDDWNNPTDVEGSAESELNNTNN